MPPANREKIRLILVDLYGQEIGDQLDLQLEESLRKYLAEAPPAAPALPGRLDQRDSILITYADMVQQVGVLPLESLASFCHKYLAGILSGIHLLPFFPYSSDDGFSVIDYRQVDPELGGWEHIRDLSREFRLVFDAVINHVSAESAWFKGFLNSDPRFADYFILPESSWDLSQVIRPRTSALLTPFQTPSGEKRVWTTFSADQVDLNYRSPRLLLEIIDLLLYYHQQGAQLIRLDAIAFIWKESGTTCLHLPQAHQIVQLFRSIFDWIAPEMHILTETNVPHADNISYFGDGTNEAHLVYNFPLPPLVLHTLQTGDCRALSRWGAALQLPSHDTTFFNFLASHDGIGLNPAREILTEDEIENIVEQTLAHGGFVNRKTNPDGSSSPYELNINYYDALNDPASNEAQLIQVNRFLCAQAIMLAFIGVPGIYFHSLFGSRGWPEGVSLKGYNRAVNRQKLERTVLETELKRAGSLRRQIFENFSALLKARASCGAFDPYGEQAVLDCGPHIFGLLRRARGDPKNAVLCLHNVSASPQQMEFKQIFAGLDISKESALQDLHSGRVWVGTPLLRMKLEPYQILWLRLSDNK